MLLKIERLITKKVNTAYGEKDKRIILAGGTWYSAFAGQWNAGWQVGSEIEIPEDRVKVTQSGDRVYRNISAPPKESGHSNGNGSSSVEVMKEVRMIYETLLSVDKKLNKVQEQLDNLIPA